MRPAIAILIPLAAPASALAQHNTAAAAHSRPPADRRRRCSAAAGTLGGDAAAVPSYGVPPGVGGTAPLSSGGTVRSVYRGSDGVPPKKKARFRRRIKARRDRPSAFRRGGKTSA
jgi:hypothetical protein